MARFQLSSILCCIASLFVITNAQAGCPNQLAFYNPNIRSSCVNGTFFIVPVDKTLVANAVKPYKLLNAPTNDPTLFPRGFPAGKHPVLVTSSLGSDIRMMQLQLQDPLFQGSILVPYVDRLSDGKSAFNFNVKSYLGSFDGQPLGALVPTVVGSAGGTLIRVAQFVPNNAAYQLIAPNEFITQIKQVIIPNPVSGPGVIPNAIDTDFFPASPNTAQNPYTSKTFHNIISQPLILDLPNVLCQRNPIYFNFTFSEPRFRTGKVTLYEPGGAFQGIYQGVGGYSAAGNQLGYTNPETCQQAAARNDPAALA